MTRQVGVALVAEHLAVDLEIGAGAPLLPPQRMLAERAVLRVEISLPQRGRLDDVAVAVKHCKVFGRHPRSSMTRSGVGFLLKIGRRILVATSSAAAGLLSLQPCVESFVTLSCIYSKSAANLPYRLKH